MRTSSFQKVPQTPPDRPMPRRWVVNFCWSTSASARARSGNNTPISKKNQNDGSGGYPGRDFNRAPRDYVRTHANCARNNRRGCERTRPALDIRRGDSKLFHRATSCAYKTQHHIRSSRTAHPLSADRALSHRSPSAGWASKGSRPFRLAMDVITLAPLGQGRRAGILHPELLIGRGRPSGRTIHIA